MKGNKLDRPWVEPPDILNPAVQETNHNFSYIPLVIHSHCLMQLLAVIST